jgi:hypothetical protein
MVGVAIALDRAAGGSTLDFRQLHLAENIPQPRRYPIYQNENRCMFVEGLDG